MSRVGCLVQRAVAYVVFGIDVCAALQQCINFRQIPFGGRFDECKVRGYSHAHIIKEFAARRRFLPLKGHTPPMSLAWKTRFGVASAFRYNRKRIVKTLLEVCRAWTRRKSAGSSNNF